MLTIMDLPEKKRTGKRCCLIAGCAWFDKLIDQDCEQREAGQSGPLQLSTAAAWTENARRRARFYGEMGPRRRMKLKCIHKKGVNAWISVSSKSPILIPEIVEEVGCTWWKRTVDGYTTALAIRQIGVLLLWSWWNKRVGSVRAHCQWSVSLSSQGPFQPFINFVPICCLMAASSSLVTSLGGPARQDSKSASSSHLTCHPYLAYYKPYYYTMYYALIRLRHACRGARAVTRCGRLIRLLIIKIIKSPFSHSSDG